MKPIKSLLVLAILCVPVLASAQGYYRRGGPGASAPRGFHNREGRLALGFSVGLGGMSDDGSSITSCIGCDYNPLAFEIDGHIGGMLSPRFALLFEAQVNGQTIHSDAFRDDTILSQGAAMIAAQVWVLPQLWLKGGLGFANLQTDNAYVTRDLGNGGAVLGAIGFEILSAPNFALDLQGRIIAGTYNSGNDHLTSGTIGLGINWY
jgi:hypothetical protein